jgi:hypothetical protein
MKASSTLWHSKHNWNHMDLQEQIKWAWNSYHKQSKTSGTRILISRRNWFWWNICTSRSCGVCSHTVCICLSLELQTIPNGYKECFLEWDFTRRGICREPKGFTNHLFLNHVYRLKKIYGLKQAQWAWYERLTKYLLDNCFQRGHTNKTLFIRKNR